MQVKNIFCSKEIIGKVYILIREALYNYHILNYKTDIFAEENKWGYYAAEESLFTHINNKQIWVLDIIIPITKEFRIFATLNRDTPVIKNFIKKFIPPGNNIIIDRWSFYNWLNNSSYHRLEHNHGRNNLDFGIEAFSNEENIWNFLKTELKKTYKSVQNKDFLYFLCEADFKYVN